MTSLATAGVHYVIHELLADWTDLLGQGGAEHHGLLLMGSGFEHFLHISAHIYKERYSSLSTPNRLSILNRIQAINRSCIGFKSKFSTQTKQLTKLVKHFIAFV